MSAVAKSSIRLRPVTGLETPALGRSYGALATIGLHLLVLGVLMFGPNLGGGHVAPYGLGKAVMLLDINMGAEAEPTPPPAIEKPVLPLPDVPVPPEIKLVYEQVGPNAISIRGGSRSAAETERSATDEIMAFLRGVRGNWLRPNGASRTFSCRVKINYEAGGLLSSVEVNEGCGSPQLIDSIERAVWKTRPLPFSNVPTRAGSLELDFSP